MQTQNNTIIHSNYQDKLKFIAIIAMFIDHVGAFFLPSLEILRVIGRVAMPIFCFFAGYNFKGELRYDILKYGIFLVIIDYLLFDKIFSLNILFTIFFGYIYLNTIYFPSFDFTTNILQIIPLIVLAPISFFIFEYGTMAFIFMLIGYLIRHGVTRRDDYIFVLSFLCCLDAQVFFWFDFYNFILLICISVLLYHLLIAKKSYEVLTRDDLAYISRHSLIIYFTHLAIFKIFYYIMIKFLL